MNAVQLDYLVVHDIVLVPYRLVLPQTVDIRTILTTIFCKKKRNTQSYGQRHCFRDLIAAVSGQNPGLGPDPHLYAPQLRSQGIFKGIRPLWLLGNDISILYRYC